MSVDVGLTNNNTIVELGKKQGAIIMAEDGSTTRTKPVITIQEADEEIAEDNITSVANTNVKNGFTQPKTEGSVERSTQETDNTQQQQSNRCAPKFAIAIEWNFTYFKTSVGLLRLLFMFCCSLSLVCLGNAGTDDVDVLDLPARSRIRFHIFSCVMVLLVGITIYVLEITSIRRSLRTNWYLVDIFSSFVLGVLCMVSSTLILHANKVEYEDDENADGDPNNTEAENSDSDDDMPVWSNALLALAAVFGYFATLVSVFLIVFKCFSHKVENTNTKPMMTMHVQEEIMMTGAANS